MVDFPSPCCYLERNEHISKIAASAFRGLVICIARMKTWTSQRCFAAPSGTDTGPQSAKFPIAYSNNTIRGPLKGGIAYILCSLVGDCRSPLEEFGTSNLMIQ